MQINPAHLIHMVMVACSGPALRCATSPLLLSLLVMGFTSDHSLSKTLEDGKICERYLPKISQTERVPLGVLYAVGLTETGVKGSLHPYALNVEGKTVITTSALEAMTVFTNARKQGKKLIDLGCMQVNHYYHGKRFASVEDMLEPQKNIVYAARLLKTLRDQHGSWAAAVALYHASPRKPKEQHRYICTVIRNLIVSGFGGWTPESRAYCKPSATQGAVTLN
jgi:Transglycosylase SLT domain